MISLQYKFGLNRAISVTLAFNLMFSQIFMFTAYASDSSAVSSSSTSSSSRGDNSGNTNGNRGTSGSATIDNDGKFRSAEQTYGDSGIAPSFKDCEYYDCYVPYAQTCEEVGGYTSSMDSSRRNSHVGDFVNWENDMFHFSGGDYWTNWNEGGTEGYESDTGLATLTDSNGTKYYVTAFPHWLWNYSGAYYQWGFQGKGNPSVGGGEIADVILTDGTCIHFVFGDAKADVHTNGGGSGRSPDSVTYSNFETTNLSQHKHYANMFQAEGGEILEVWGTLGSHSNFWNKYNFKYMTGDGNHIAFVRMYNKKISDNPQPASPECKNVSYQAKGGTVRNSTLRELPITGEFVEEEGFVPFNQLHENSIALPTRDSLNVFDKSALSKWKEDIAGKNKAKVISYERAVIMLLGILLCIYGIFLYVAYHFDSVNNFIDISLLSTFTFGRLFVAPDGVTSTWRKGSSPQAVIHTDILKIVLITEFVGVLIASGKIFSIIIEVINFIQKHFL